MIDAQTLSVTHKLAVRKCLAVLLPYFHSSNCSLKPPIRLRLMLTLLKHIDHVSYSCIIQHIMTTSNKLPVCALLQLPESAVPNPSPGFYFLPGSKCFIRGSSKVKAISTRKDRKPGRFRTELDLDIPAINVCLCIS